MAKLTSFDKELFDIYSEQMFEEGIKWAFCRETGVTVIYKEMPKGNFIKLSVAYCNGQDEFKKKIGLITAFDRWQNDMAIQVPNVGYSAEGTIKMFVDLITENEAFLHWKMPVAK